MIWGPQVLTLRRQSADSNLRVRIQFSVDRHGSLWLSCFLTTGLLLFTSKFRMSPLDFYCAFGSRFTIFETALHGLHCGSSSSASCSLPRRPLLHHRRHPRSLPSHVRLGVTVRGRERRRSVPCFAKADRFGRLLTATVRTFCALSQLFPTKVSVRLKSDAQSQDQMI